MNQELTQRIIGAVVVTALAAIFIPMLFDDPVEDSDQVINPLEIPEQQFSTDAPSAAPTLPETIDDIEPADETDFENPAEAENASPELSDQELLAEPPADTEADEEPEFGQALQQTPKPAAKSPTPANTKAASQTSKSKTGTTAKPASPKPEPKTETQNPDLKRWYLQAGSFSKQVNAQSLADKLKKQGMPVFMETIKVPGKGTFYRLRIGPELEKSRAQAMQKTLSQQKINSLLMSE